MRGASSRAYRSFVRANLDPDRALVPVVRRRSMRTTTRAVDADADADAMYLLFSDA